MTKAGYELFSLQAVVAAGVLYFLAFLAQLASRPPRVAAVQPAAEQVLVGAEGAAQAPATPVPPVESVRRPVLAHLGITLLPMAALVHLGALITRGLAADPVRVPWGNMYEFTLTATFAVIATYLATMRRWSLEWLAPVVTGFVLVTLMADSLWLYEGVMPLRDALQSPWLVIHVVAAIIATGAFCLGGMASALYLLKERWPGRLTRVPALGVLDQVAYRMHAFGFPVWTFAALITGPIWAHQAWGTAWNWDPKEVWAFVTWVAYAAYLHARATAGWKGSRAAVLALVALASLLFNFVGINFFFGSGSMHSYAAPVVRLVLG